MENPKFTPGPWRIGNHSCIVECGSKDDTPASYQKIEVQHLLFVPGETERAKANARLIAAAPEMYELLRQIAKLDTPGETNVSIRRKAVKLSWAAEELMDKINTNE